MNIIIVIRPIKKFYRGGRCVGGISLAGRNFGKRTHWETIFKNQTVPDGYEVISEEEMNNSERSEMWYAHFPYTAMRRGAFY